jgi:hypothetical protein
MASQSQDGEMYYALQIQLYVLLHLLDSGLASGNRYISILYVLYGCDSSYGVNTHLAVKGSSSCDH